MALLKQRLNWASAARVIKHQEHNRLLDRMRDVSESQVVLCSQKHQVSCRMQEIRRELKRRGISDETIFSCDVGTGDSPLPTSPFEGGVETVAPILGGIPTPPFDRSMWFAEVSRSQAKDILIARPSGTFLIRPSAIADQFALSVK